MSHYLRPIIDTLCSFCMWLQYNEFNF